MLSDPLILARAQFGLNIGFHILFPTISIGLAWVLLCLRLKASDASATWVAGAYRLWVKIFALTFALGVVSGITMSFQFGTNWPGFMEKVGNIAGPLLGYEVLTAFFLEATFLGVMLFGRDRVPPWRHTLSGFLVAGISAFQLLHNPAADGPRRLLRAGVFTAALLAPIQIVVGDFHGLNTLEHQPAKIAAIEGIWNTERGAPLLLFAVPNAAEKRNDFAIGIPGGASLILTHDANGEIRGLNEFAGKTPPVLPVFFAFRVMVGMGVAMLLASWLGS